MHQRDPDTADEEGTSAFVEFPESALDVSIPSWFEHQAARHADRLAVRSQESSASYAELNCAANRLAHVLVDRTGRTAEPIAFLFDHDTHAIAAMLGILKAGKIAVALDPAQPAAQLAPVVAQAGVRLIVADARHAGAAQALGTDVEVLDAGTIDPAGRGDDLGLAIDPDAPATISYTSGSTGEPKGVVSSHRGVMHRAMVQVNHHRLVPGDRLTLFHSLSVGSSLRQLFGALLSGAAIFPFDVRAEGLDRLARWLVEERITLFHAAASVFRNFASALTGGEEFPDLRVLFVANEPVFPSDVELYRARFPDRCRFVVGMGITEVGTVCEYVMDKGTPIEDGVVPIGWPAPGKEVRLVDDDGAEVAPGEVGEIAVRTTLHGSYWRRPDLDRATFLPEPAGGRACTYRTGDLGRKRPDGALVHLGRKDARWRLRGQFVDSLAVEQRLLEHRGISGATVVLREDRAGDQRVVAYVVPVGASAPSASELRRFTGETLPAHMVPSVFVTLHALPRTASGKVDRRGLPVPGRARPHLLNAFTAPGTPIERELTKIWAEALGLDAVGIHDDFLELGGHSLLATLLISRVREAFAVDVPASALLEASRVTDMAAVVLEHLLRKLPLEARDRLLAEDEASRAAAPPDALA